MSGETHIASLALRARPDRLDALAEEIAARGLAEVALTDPRGRLVLALETANEAEIVDALTALQLLDGVVSVALVYHHAEDLTEAGAA